MGDLPDYTKQVVIRYEGGFLGLEELAVRLGFIGPWDLKGNIVLMEDFESEETEWVDVSDPVTCTATRSSRQKYSGDWSVKLYNDGSANAYAALKRYIHFPGLLKYAAFCRLGWDEDCQQIIFSIELYTGSDYYRAQVRYNLITATLAVGTTGSSWYTVDAALALSPTAFTWHPMLVTFNLETGYYDKLYFADKEYDISNIALYTMGVGYNPSGEIAVEADRINPVAFTVYVDDIIIAKNVP